MNPLQDFHNIMRGLSLDYRLGPYVAELAGMEPAEVVLKLTIALADATEGRRIHPAIATLARLEANHVSG